MYVLLSQYKTKSQYKKKLFIPLLNTRSEFLFFLVLVLKKNLKELKENSRFQPLNAESSLKRDIIWKRLSRGEKIMQLYVSSVSENGFNGLQRFSTAYRFILFIGLLKTIW